MPQKGIKNSRGGQTWQVSHIPRPSLTSLCPAGRHQPAALEPGWPEVPYITLHPPCKRTKSPHDLCAQHQTLKTTLHPGWKPQEGSCFIGPRSLLGLLTPSGHCVSLSQLPEGGKVPALTSTCCQPQPCWSFSETATLRSGTTSTIPRFRVKNKVQRG